MALPFIQQGLEQIAEVYDVSKEHRFEMWVLGFFHWNEDFSSSNLEAIYNQSLVLLEDDGPGDQCLDGYYYDKENLDLYLYQAKWKSDEKATCSLREARELHTALQYLLSDIEENASLGQARNEIVETIKEITSSKEGKIYLRGVTNASWNQKHKSEITSLVNSLVENKVVVEFFGGAELANAKGMATKDLSGKIIKLDYYNDADCIKIPKPDSSEVTGIGKSAILMVSGFSLAKEAAPYSSRLFERNVRQHLGSKQRVNKDMQETLEDPEIKRKSFWYGHNGITILCDNFTTSSNNIKITNPQIVNGCQTTVTIRDMFSDPQKRVGDDFGILVRLITLVGSEEDKRNAAIDLAFRTNNQTAVNDADLRSNDPEQRAIQQMIRSYGDGWFYERKRKEWDSYKKDHRAQAKKFKGKPDRVICRDDYQQAWRSYKGAPAEAISRKNDVWSRDIKDLYSEVFSKDRRPCDIVWVTVLFDWFSQVFSVKKDNSSLAFDIFPGLQPDASRLKRAKMLLSTHSVALYGYLIDKYLEENSLSEFSKTDIDTLLANLPRGSEVKRTWNKKSWTLLGDAVYLIMDTWSSFLMHKDGVREEEGENLTSALKKNRSFELLKDILERRRGKSYSELLP